MTSGVEPDVRDFLKRIIWSITVGFLYMIINATMGIWGEWLFFEDRPTTGNYIFYAWLVLSTAGLILLLVKWWKKKYPHG